MINNVKQTAIQITSRALSDLYNARNELENASNWGLFDIIGGRFLSSGIKHDKIRYATNYIHQAQRSLRSFDYDYSEKLGVNDIEDIRTNDILAILDIFADNPLSDISMQSRIRKTLRQVNDSIERVEYMLEGLTN